MCHRGLRQQLTSGSLTLREFLDRTSDQLSQLWCRQCRRLYFFPAASPGSGTTRSVVAGWPPKASLAGIFSRTAGEWNGSSRPEPCNGKTPDDEEKVRNSKNRAGLVPGSNAASNGYRVAGDYQSDVTISSIRAYASTIAGRCKIKGQSSQYRSKPTLESSVWSSLEG